MLEMETVEVLALGSGGCGGLWRGSGLASLGNLTRPRQKQATGYTTVGTSTLNACLTVSRWWRVCSCLRLTLTKKHWKKKQKKTCCRLMRSLTSEGGGSSVAQNAELTVVWLGMLTVTPDWEKVVACVFVSACKSKWFPKKHGWIWPEKPFEEQKRCWVRDVGTGLEVFTRGRWWRS